MAAEDVIAGTVAPQRRWSWLAVVGLLALSVLWLPPTLRDVPPALVLPLTERVGAALNWFRARGASGPCRGAGHHPRSCRAVRRADRGARHGVGGGL